MIELVCDRDPESSVELVRDGLLADGVVILRRFPVEPREAFARFGAGLGAVSDAAVTAPGVTGGAEHEVRERAEPLRDRYGQPVLSTTNAPFPCHTDDFFSEHPCDIVLLLCVRSAPTGGDSTIAYGADVIGHLDVSVRQTLQHQVFPVPFGFVAVLARRAEGTEVRYNRLEIEKEYRDRSASPPADVVTAMDALDRAIRGATRTLRLAPGDCLIIDNHTVLHGRTAFPAGTDRLLRRMKVYR